MQKIYEHILSSIREKHKIFALLLDPEKDNSVILGLLSDEALPKPDFVFVGGSQLTTSVENFVATLKQKTNVPVIIFPGSFLQPAANADALLFLSLISGRNSEFLIEQQIKSAPMLKHFDMDIIPTGYILIEGGCDTAVKLVSRTEPYPQNALALIADTALAGELLGMKLIYLEAGSGAKNPVPQDVISKVRTAISVPLIVGGGLKSPDDIIKALNAGADIIVVGNWLESNPYDLPNFIKTVKYHKTI